MRRNRLPMFIYLADYKLSLPNLFVSDVTKCRKPNTFFGKMNVICTRNQAKVTLLEFPILCDIRIMWCGQLFILPLFTVPSYCVSDGWKLRRRRSANLRFL